MTPLNSLISGFWDTLKLNISPQNANKETIRGRDFSFSLRVPTNVSFSKY